MWLCLVNILSQSPVHSCQLNLLPETQFLLTVSLVMSGGCSCVKHGA